MLMIVFNKIQMWKMSNNNNNWIPKSKKQMDKVINLLGLKQMMKIMLIDLLLKIMVLVCK